MIGKVESVEKSKTGKSWRVKIDRKFYGAKFDSNIETALGKPINFTFKSDPQYGDWLESWAYDNSQPAPASPNTAAQPSGDRFYMPFVSNVVAHAIASGQIKTPADLNAWAKAAHDAAVALDAL